MVHSYLRFSGHIVRVPKSALQFAKCAAGALARRDVISQSTATVLHTHTHTSSEFRAEFCYSECETAAVCELINLICFNFCLLYLFLRKLMCYKFA